MVPSILRRQLQILPQISCRREIPRNDNCDDPTFSPYGGDGAKFNRLIWKLVAEDFKDGGRTEEMSFSRLRDYAATTRGVHINHGKPFWESRGCAFSVPETRNGLKMIKGSCRHAYFSPCQAPPEPNFASLHPICIQDGILHGKRSYDVTI